MDAGKIEIFEIHLIEFKMVKCLLKSQQAKIMARKILVNRNCTN